MNWLFFIIFFRDINEKESVSYTLRETLFDVMRVYINLVHDYNETCKYSYFYYFSTLLKRKFGWTPRIQSDSKDKIQLREY